MDEDAGLEMIDCCTSEGGEPLVNAAVSPPSSNCCFNGSSLSEYHRGARHHKNAAQTPNAETVGATVKLTRGSQLKASVLGRNSSI